MGTASQSAANTQIKEKWFTKQNRKQAMFGCSSAGTWFFLMWLRRNSASLSVLWEIDEHGWVLWPLQNWNRRGTTALGSFLVMEFYRGQSWTIVRQWGKGHKAETVSQQARSQDVWSLLGEMPRMYCALFWVRVKRTI